MGIFSFLTHPLVAGPAVGGIVVLIAYVDSKLRDVKREKETYWKLFAVTSLIATIAVYLVVEEFTKSDEFLNQRYETEVPGGMLPHHDSSSYQPTMRGPTSDVTRTLENLVPGDIDEVAMLSHRVPRRSHKSSRRSRRR